MAYTMSWLIMLCYGHTLWIVNMAYEIIRFTIADPLLSTLKGMAAGDESLHLTAKRVITEILEGKQPTIEPDRLAELESKLEKLENLGSSVIAPHALEKIGDRLSTLEEGGFQLDPDDLDRLINVVKQRISDDLVETFQTIRDRLNELEKDQPENHEIMKNLVERIENLEGWISSLRDDRALAKCSLGKFSDRLDALEKGKVETAPREIPKGMTHKQIAEICDVSVYAVTKMAHDRAKWPEGFMWSDESKKWFPMEV
jgi:CRP-like cAMP-binding protein